MSDSLKLTVYLSTYNQEDYVAEALDSILMQKTDFDFEIVAADDCSTDGTQQIILDYQKKYPGKIVTYFTNPNVGGCKKLTNCIDKGLFRGDYLAYLEGDDYWLGEDRLQTLVDFLEEHPEYSRVSHNRKVINDAGDFIGYDVKKDVLDTSIDMAGFLDGKLYSDFGSVFRNYFKIAKSKYNPLFLASRNVCDFQDMFITQDFGPVYVMDRCFGVYRSRSVAGATNYNSITSQKKKNIENIILARKVMEFYNGKYDLTPMIQRYQKRLLGDAVDEKSDEEFSEIREYISESEMVGILPEMLYLLKRGKKKESIDFLLSRLTKNERRFINIRVFKYAVRRVFNKLTGRKINELKRGYIVKQQETKS